MRHLIGICSLCLFGSVLAYAQQAVEEFTAQELSVIETIKAQNRTAEEMQAPMQAPSHVSDATDTTIQLSDQTKEQAWQAQKEKENIQTQPPETTEIQAEQSEQAASSACLTVAFIDIDEAFNAHPRTQAVKKQIDQKIKSKQREVQQAKEIISALEAENQLLSRQLAELKPFYERIVTDQLLLPAVPENADSLAFSNLLNRFLFSGSETLSTSPLNSPAQLEDITHRMTENKKIIAQRSFFIDNYKYQTREEILKLEQEEVQAILQDIYSEIKSFAQKRNIGAIVRKDEILYGQDPVNVTKDFINRLKKSKKYRKK